MTKDVFTIKVGFFTFKIFMAGFKLFPSFEILEVSAAIVHILVIILVFKLELHLRLLGSTSAATHLMFCLVYCIATYSQAGCTTIDTTPEVC